MKSLQCRSILLLSVVAWCSGLPRLASADNEAAWNRLSQQVEARHIELTALIRDSLAHIESFQQAGGSCRN